MSCLLASSRSLLEPMVVHVGTSAAQGAVVELEEVEAPALPAGR